jgi:threonine dehydratase
MARPEKRMDILQQQLAPPQIEAAAARIRPYVRRTPCLTVDGADLALPGIEVVFKLEFMQHAGSFKARGAFNNLLSRNVPTTGVVAASGGNHGVAVAFAAMRTGCAATIFVPNVASPVKIEQIRAYGATLQITGERYADALAASQEFAKRSGALPVHAFDQLETLLGQATLGVEMEQDGPALDALLVAVGGGGLIGGLAAWYRGRVPIIGVEPEQAPTLTHALAAGGPVDAPAGGIAADSLAPRQVGGLMFPIAQRFVAATVLVTDDAIRSAQRTLWNHLRLVVEPGGAAAFAALQSGVWKPAAGQSIGVLLCGANTAAVSFN